MTADRGSDSLSFGDLLRQHRHAAGLAPGRAGRAGRDESPAASATWSAVSARTPTGRRRGLLAEALGLRNADRSAFLLAARRPLTSAAGQERRVDRLPVPLPPSLAGTRNEPRSAASCATTRSGW